MQKLVFISCRKSQDRERDLKLLLDMYKTVPKETREKAQVCCLTCFFVCVVKILSKLFASATPVL